ncbi:MAG: transglutaminase [Clostridiaceae bacterium]|nr:transglutaminase [Clostridiaceae bacterium]
MNEKYRNYLSCWLIGVFYLFAVIKASLMPMHIPVYSWHMLLFAVGAFVFYSLLNTFAGRIVFLSSIAIGIIYMAIRIAVSGIGSVMPLLSYTEEFVKMIVKVGTGYYDETVPYYVLMYGTGLLSVIAAMPIYYFLVRRFRFYPLIVPGLVFFMMVWGLIRYVDKLSFFIFIIVAIIAYIRHNYLLYSIKTGEVEAFTKHGDISVYFVPIVLVLILLGSFIPKNPLPIQWPWVRDKINTTYWELYYKYSVDRYDDFSLANTGFGDPSRLGGPVVPDYTPVMTVKAPARVYLRGAVYDKYTGVGWEKTERDKQEYLTDRFYDNEELKYGWKAAVGSTIIMYGDNIVDLSASIDETEQLQTIQVQTQTLNLSESIDQPEQYLNFLKQKQMPDELKRLFPEGKLTIRHLNVRTRTIFTPLKIFLPITGLTAAGYSLEEDLTGTIKADRRLGGNTRYEISYIQPCYGMTELDNFFHASSPGMYYEFIEKNLDYLRDFEAENSENAELIRQEVNDVIDLFRQFKRHRDEVYELYTQLPENLPERVFELVSSLTSDADTVYGKVKSIEGYLRKNYSYTLTPGYTPDEQDFVDYFLFELKQGYCSYYASAMCIMTRAAGIPARYVEGFVLPGTADNDGYYHVTNQNAHAWVEVYLEGVGWVSFEPTPPFVGAMNYLVPFSSSTYSSEDPYAMYDESYAEQYMEFYERQGYGTEGYNIEQNDISSVKVILYSAAVILVIALINLLFILARRAVLRLMAPKKTVLFIYRYIASLLKHTGCMIMQGETPKDFAVRVDERYNFLKMSMTDMTDIYYSVRYGSRIPDNKTIGNLLKFASEVKIKTGQNMYTAARVLRRGFLFQG